MGVGGFSHLAFKKITVVLNSLKKTVTSVLENKKTLGTRLVVFICLIVLLMASGKKGMQQMQVSEAL